jgi:formylglycine-generating enzyme required for sulfatase activity
MAFNRSLTGISITFTCALIANCGLPAQSTAVRSGSPGQGMRFISAAGKSFQMGDSAYLNTLPVNLVKFSRDFYIDTIEVTQTDYSALMGVNPSFFSNDLRLPVERVTWFDAALYCNARSKRDKLDTVYRYTLLYGIPGDGCYLLDELFIDYARSGYRLPTEAEWEYACRAGEEKSQTVDIDGLNSSVWWAGNAGNITHVGALKFPNAWGLYDMNGNVWEWCNDWYAKSYPSGFYTDPAGPSSGDSRVLRGGSWQSDATMRRWSYRFSNVPNDERKNRSRYGFRCVKRR